MADVPTIGSVSFSQMRGSVNTGQGVSLGSLNLHNLNTPQRLGQIATTETQGTSKKAPSLYSTDAQNSILGLYSMKLANPYYTGPAIQAQRSSDNSSLDFWADADGMLTSATGNTYSSWVGSGTANLLTWYDQSINDMAVLRYPPASLTAGGTTNPGTATLSGQPYGNGSYTFSASSQASTSEGVFAAFNMSGNYQQYTTLNATDPYSTSTGAYTGSTSTTVSGTAYTGAWIQLQLPYAIYPTGFFKLSTPDRNELSYVFAGSNNGTTWTLLYSDTELAYTTARTITFNSTASYSYYRLIARTANPGAASGYWSLKQLDIYGRQTLTAGRNALATTASGGNPPKIVVDPISAISPYLVGTATANHSAPTSNVAIVLPGTSGNYVSFGSTHPAHFNTTTSNLFMEAWVYCNAANGSVNQQIIAVTDSSSSDWNMFIGTDNKVHFGYWAPTYTEVITSGTISFAAWNHVALSWDQGTRNKYIFLNGSMTGPTTSGTTGVYTATRELRLGSETTGSVFNGYIRDVRVVQGGSVPTASFTPDQAPFQMVAPAYTPNMGTPVLGLYQQYLGNGKYIIYFPNGAATTASYYGLTFGAQTISAAMIQYMTLTNPSTYQTFLAGSTDISIKYTTNTLLGATGDFLA